MSVAHLLKLLLATTLVWMMNKTLFPIGFLNFLITSNSRQEIIVMSMTGKYSEVPP